MTDLEKEIVRTFHWGYSAEAIADIYDLDIEDAKKIIADNKEYIKELEVRDYGNI